MLQYARVEPYWPDVFWHYWHMLVIVAGHFMLTSVGLYGCLLLWRRWAEWRNDGA